MTIYSSADPRWCARCVNKTTKGAAFHRRIREPQYKERTIISSRGTIEEELEEEDSAIGFAGEGEVTIIEEETEGGSQLTEGTDQPKRALRSKGAAPAIQLGTREAVVEVTATAWNSKSESAQSTILRGETGGPDHRRQEDDLGRPVKRRVVENINGWARRRPVHTCPTRGKWKRISVNRQI